MSGTERNGKRGNTLLDALGRAELQRLAPHLMAMPLAFKEGLHEQREPVSYVYFPTCGVVSLVIVLDEHDDSPDMIEAGTIGREGMVGISAVLGMTTAPTRAFCQVPGRAWRLRAQILVAELQRSLPLRTLLLRYANAMMGMFAQVAACNRAHAVEARMARWLLMTRDRVDDDTFPLTQEFLAQMLGVRRPAVSLTGSILQRAGLIRYTRGRIAILDRPGLEAAACECYANIRRAYDASLAGD